MRFCSFLCTLWSVGVHSWSHAIHQKIGTVAMQIINRKPGLAKKVNALFKGDLQEFVSFGHDHFNSKYHFTERLHFQPQKDWTCSLGSAAVLPHTTEDYKTNYAPCNDGHENHCLLGCMYYIFGRFANQDLTAYQGMVVPPVTKLLDVKRGLPHQFTDTKIIRWLMTLVADLHEPMHFGFRSDDFGKKIKVTYQKNEYSLFDFWDNEVGKTFVDYGAVERLEEKDFADPLSFFEHWAEESVKLVCDEIYGRLAKPNEPIPTTFEVNDETYAAWVELSRKQILKAGERTALLLENILEHLKSHELTSEGRQYHFGESRRRKNLLTNLAIAAVFFQHGSFSRNS
eukprot:GEMP01009713.1.p1 GENE.GEMP01009713.1~~GEMP01009713.1.p1  ORF type:complete len:342 (+),score=43.58 GEMP01009713.1:39-1064(+)